MSNRRNRARRNKCDTGKTRFRDHKDATDSLRHFARISEREDVPHRAYKCPMCHGWHITKSDFGEWPAPKDKFEEHLATRVRERFG